MEQVSCIQIRDSIDNQLDKVTLSGTFIRNDDEPVLGCGSKGRHRTVSQGMTISDPTSTRKLITPDTSLSSVKDSLKWIVYCIAYVV